MIETELFGFTFDGEAGESFQTACDKFIGWTVRITTESGEQFDAELRGADYNSEFYNDVRVIRIEERVWLARERVGDEFTVTVRNIHVY